MAEMIPSTSAMMLDSSVVNPFGLFFSAIWLMKYAIVVNDNITTNVIK